MTGLTGDLDDRCAAPSPASFKEQTRSPAASTSSPPPGAKPAPPRAALAELVARRTDGTEPTLADTHGPEVVELTTDRGELKIIPEPEGTRGYEDLRRAATREHLGQGLRPAVASLGVKGATIRVTPQAAAR